MPADKTAARLLIQGQVQGVGYRFYAQDLANTLGLVGWVRNLPDSNVEAFVEGPRPVIKVFIEKLEKGPSMARVENVTVDWQTPQERCTSFSIVP